MGQEERDPVSQPRTRDQNPPCRPVATRPVSDGYVDDLAGHGRDVLVGGVGIGGRGLRRRGPDERRSPQAHGDHHLTGSRRAGRRQAADGVGAQGVERGNQHALGCLEDAGNAPASRQGLRDVTERNRPVGRPALDTTGIARDACGMHRLHARNMSRTMGQGRRLPPTTWTAVMVARLSARRRANSRAVAAGNLYRCGRAPAPRLACRVIAASGRTPGCPRSAAPAPRAPRSARRGASPSSASRCTPPRPTPAAE